MIQSRQDIKGDDTVKEELKSKKLTDDELDKAAGGCIRYSMYTGLWEVIDDRSGEVLQTFASQKNAEEYEKALQFYTSERHDSGLARLRGEI